jgi:exonuclease III
VKFVALNLRHGGGARVAAIAGWLDGHAADVLVLGEYRDNAAGAALRGLLEARGWHLAAASKGSGVNGVLVAAREPLQAVDITPEDAATGALLLATLVDGSRVLGAYFPNNLAKRPFFARCHEAARAHADEPFVLVGDLNTGCNLRDVQPGAAKFLCVEDFAALESECALTDLWRGTHGDTAREWTWLSRVGNGYRLDHAFANAAFGERHGSVVAHYLHETREAGLSDHSALRVEAVLRARNFGN